MNGNLFTLSLCGKNITFEFNKLATSCNSSVIVRCEDTVLLCTAVMSKEKSNTNFLPLIVNYEERLYAAGKIPGCYIKREGRPTQNAILNARIIDRTIRPFINENIRNEIQIVITVLCVGDMNPDILALLGVNIMLSVSDIPFNDEIGSIKLSLKDNKLTFLPTITENDNNIMELIVSGTKDKITMIESCSYPIKQENMLEYINEAHEYIKNFIKFVEKIKKIFGKEKLNPQIESTDIYINFILENNLDKEIKYIISDKLNFNNLSINIKKILESYKDIMIEKELSMDILYETCFQLVKKYMKENILKKDIRLDGRKSNQLRDLYTEIDFLPRTHGSAIFKRGETQVLNICTLGTLNEDQRLDTLELEDSKRFLLHYNFYPYSTGEVGRIGPTSRREIGHGALGEKAFKYLIPNENIFPYTIRMVSEVTDSNGSTSQASICATSLSLMAAGVPIEKHVAGIAMGLVEDKTKGEYRILTDIRGIEDKLGEMDFKIAGTEDGITALQLDVKNDGLTKEILKEIFLRALDARNIILSKMSETIKNSRENVSDYAYKYAKINIDPKKIKIVIGPNGKQINAIIEKTNTKIDIEQSGEILIYGKNTENVETAKKIIKSLVKEIKIGDIFLGKVKRIERYGVFVKIDNDKEALVHISRLTKKKFQKIEEIVKIGDYINIKIIDIDNGGRLRAESIKMDG